MDCPKSTQGPRTASSAGGFSLLEMAISVAILAMVLVSALSSNLSAQRLAKEADETQAALRALESARVEIESASLVEVTDLVGTLAPGAPVPVPAVLDNQVITYALPDWTAGDPIPDPLGIRVTINWTSSRGQNRTLSLVDAVR